MTVRSAAGRMTTGKTCKYLDSLLDTEADIKQRKKPANIAMKSLEDLLRDKDLKNHIKIHVFNTLVGSVFLHNTEIWTTKKTIDGALDSFNRRMLRKAVNIVYPRKISNIDL